MQIRAIDTHVHCWDPAFTQYSWLDSVPALNRAYGLEMLEEERMSVEVGDGVLVQAANSLEDTKWMLNSAQKCLWIKGIVAWLPMQDPAETARIIDTDFSHQPLIKGIRHLIHDEADPAWLLQDTVLESLQIIADAGLSYDFVGVNSAHLETALKLTTKIPGLKIVLDHLNQPPAESAVGFAFWKSQLAALAGNQNIYAKISGLGTTLGKGETWRAEEIKPSVEFAIETFGDSRCFCGGDWPVSLLAGSYSKTWTNYRTVLQDAGDINFQEKILYRNAIDFYGILEDTI